MIRLSELMGGLAILSPSTYTSAVNFGNIKLSSFGHIKLVRLSIVAYVFTAICVSTGFIDGLVQQC